MMRTLFEKELSDLNADLIQMGAYCESACTNVVNLLQQEGDFTKTTRQIHEYEQKTDELQKSLESACIKVIFSQQPVAGDLRLISSVMKMVADLERIADQTSDIADLLESNQALHGQTNATLVQMAKLVTNMLHQSLQSFMTRDATLAKSVSSMDDGVDGCFKQIRQQLVQTIDPDEAELENWVDVLMIAKYLERIGDHSVNVSESVIFCVDGPNQA